MENLSVLPKENETFELDLVSDRIYGYNLIRTELNFYIPIVLYQTTIVYVNFHCIFPTFQVVH